MKKFLRKLIPETSFVRLSYHRSKAFFAALIYRFPARHLTVIGITGTDGKTTTVGMVAHILLTNGVKTGALSTAFFQICDTVTWNPTQKTSPTPFIVQKFLRQCVTAGCTHVVLECSSHGLLQGRVNHTWPTVAGITNLSEEHLDYHGSMEKYLKAKSRLFLMLRKDCGLSVLNIEDRSFKDLQNIKSPWRMTYSLHRKFDAPTSNHECGVWIENGKAETGFVTGTVCCNADSDTYPLRIPVSGAFNLQNALCAICCTHGVNIMLSDAVSALNTFQGIPGRMERVDAGQPFSVYIDFTVTPQSYESTLSTLRASMKSQGRLLVLAGSCGDRMKEKRPLVGKIVSSYADVTVISNEDPYTENPERIIDEVWSGVDQKKTEAHRISDRREAIKFLLKKARKDDIVIFCGKGSDTTMWVNSGQIPWNEREIVASELRAL